MNLGSHGGGQVVLKTMQVFTRTLITSTIYLQLNEIKNICPKLEAKDHIQRQADTGTNLNCDEQSVPNFIQVFDRSEDAVF